MNSSDLVAIIPGVFNKELCATLKDEFDQIHSARWVARTELHPFRALDDKACKYKCALNMTLGKEYYNRLLSISPIIENNRVAEIVINKYEIGDYIPFHKDNTIYTYNLVINIEDSEDNGIIIEDTFFPDVAGRAVVFKGTGKKHAVPKVKSKRYVLIYLYEKR